MYSSRHNSIQRPWAKLNCKWIVRHNKKYSLWISSTLASFAYLSYHVAAWHSVSKELFYIIIKIHSPAYIEFYLLHNGYLIWVKRFSPWSARKATEREMKMKIDVEEFSRERGKNTRESRGKKKVWGGERGWKYFALLAQNKFISGEGLRIQNYLNILWKYIFRWIN